MNSDLTSYHPRLRDIYKVYGLKTRNCRIFYHFHLLNEIPDTGSKGCSGVSANGSTTRDVKFFMCQWVEIVLNINRNMFIITVSTSLLSNQLLKQ